MSKLFCFSGGRYVRYDMRTGAADPGYPLPVSTTWAGLPPAIDAAFNGPEGHSYFFAGPDCFTYDTKSERVSGREAIASRWPGVTASRIDAALRVGSKLHLFRGDQHWRFDLAAHTLGAEFPKPIAASWPGLFPADLDGALNLGNGKAVFFKGNEYVRYNLATSAIEPGFPQPIAPDWPGLFASDVRAPLMFGYAGIDCPQYPGDAIMNDLWSSTNLRWCSFYLGNEDAPPPSRYAMLRVKGWGLAPIFIGTPPPGPLPPLNAVEQAAIQAAGKAHLPPNSTIYLQLNSPGPITPEVEAYYAAWVTGIIARGFAPGFRCAAGVAETFRAIDSRPVFWVNHTTDFPTGTNVTYAGPLPAPEPLHSGVGFATLWQFAEKTRLLLAPTASLAACNLCTASVADPSRPG